MRLGARECWPGINLCRWFIWRCDRAGEDGHGCPVPLPSDQFAQVVYLASCWRRRARVSRALPSCCSTFSASAFYRNFRGLSERKLQMALRSYRYVLFWFGRFGVTGVLGWGFTGAIDWLGGELVGLAVHFDGRESHSQFGRTGLLDGYDATGYVGALGEDGLSVNLDGRRKNGGKGVAGMVFVAGQGLADGGADGRALGNGDEGGLLRRLAGDYLAGDRLG